MFSNNQICKQFNQVTHKDWSIRGSRDKAWIVYLCNQPIDIVWFEDGSTADFIKKSLIKQDGYDSNIDVIKPN